MNTWTLNFWTCLKARVSKKSRYAVRQLVCQPLVCGNVDNILCLRRKHLLGLKQVSTSIVWGTMIRDVNRNFDWHIFCGLPLGGRTFRWENRPYCVKGTGVPRDTGHWHRENQLRLNMNYHELNMNYSWITIFDNSWELYGNYMFKVKTTLELKWGGYSRVNAQRFQPSSH